MTKRDDAKQDYLAGMKYKDIAEKYDVSLSTVKSWKSRYWSSETKVATSTKKVATKSQKVATAEKLHPAIQELDDSSLNDKQKRFVMEYVRLSNATQAYINAYGAEYNTAKTNGPKLLENTGIQTEIKRLRQTRLAEYGIGVFDLVDDLAKEAKADIGNYIDFGSYDVISKGQEGKIELDVDDNPIIEHRSWIQVKDKSQVDTSLIKKINKGKDGLIVELQDKNKARDKLLDMLLGKGVFADGDGEQKININMDSFEEKDDGDN